jgi:phosphopantothenate---cysteine ligase (ATP)
MLTNRQKTLEPYTRHFSSNELLDSLQMTDNDSIQGKDNLFSTNIYIYRWQNLVDPSKIARILPVLKERNDAAKSGRMLKIPFTTLTDYLWLLRASTASMATLGNRAMVYLAAAVSDFYLPLDQLVRHSKITLELFASTETVAGKKQDFNSNWF